MARAHSIRKVTAVVGAWCREYHTSFVKVVDLGVTTLEMDVVISKDRKVVVSHDTYFNHEITTKPGGDTVTESDGAQDALQHELWWYQEIWGLKTSFPFPSQQKMPVYKTIAGWRSIVLPIITLHLLSTKRSNVYYNIETKSTVTGDDNEHPKPAVFVDPLINVIKEKRLEQWVIIQSFDIRTLQYLHKTYPGIKTALLLEDKKPLRNN